MSYRYAVFGLNIEADQAIPGLREATEAASTDLRIGTGPLGRDFPATTWASIYEHAARGIQGRPLVRVWRERGSDRFRFLYDDGAQFLIELAGRRIHADWPAELTIDDVGPYIVGPILGFVLRRLGVVCLHASAVAVGDDAIALVGETTAGKSTTAAAFAQRGHPVLSDDIVALVDRGDSFGVSPAYPWLRLWPASVRFLFGSAEALPRISQSDPNWDKRYLDLTGEEYSFSDEPLPLRAAYILDARSGESRAPYVREAPASEKLLSLIRNTYMNRLLGRKERGLEFDLLGRLLAHVPVRVVVPHGSAARLPRLCDVILEDLATSRMPERGKACRFRHLRPRSSDSVRRSG